MPYSLEEKKEFQKFLQSKIRRPDWSQGIELVKNSRVTEISKSETDLKFHVTQPGRPIAFAVNLWPAEEDTYCECEEHDGLCKHVAAACLFWVQAVTTHNEVKIGQIEYEIVENSKKELELKRFIVTGNGNKEISMSLTSLLGGIRSGRISLPEPVIGKIDLALESGLNEAAFPWQKMIKHLSELSCIKFNGERLTVFPTLRLRTVALTKLSHSEFALSWNPNPSLDWKIEANVLHFTQKPRFSLPHAPVSLTEVMEIWLPKFETEQVPFESRDTELPKFVEATLNAFMSTQKFGNQLVVTAKLEYGSPAIASLIGNQWHFLSTDRWPKRLAAAEKLWTSKLRDELNLVPGVLTKFEGEDAVRMGRKLEKWNLTNPESLSSFSGYGNAKFRINWDDPEAPVCEFYSPSQPTKSVRFEKVCQAADSRQSFVEIGHGLGFLETPVAFLATHRQWIEKILAAKNSKDPRTEISAKIRLREFEIFLNPGAQTFEPLKTQDYVAPLGFKSEILRHYQRAAAGWIQCHFEAGFGILLADDMGLGKTLTTLSVLRSGEKNLVIAPTSVLNAWVADTAKFRPDLKLSLFHGVKRTLNPDADIVLTSFAIAREEIGKLGQIQWEALVLDEAQEIRNPHTLTSQALFSLNANRRLALSGTPVQNRMDDLGSIFHFLQPGLLPLSERATEWDISAVKKFILRRTRAEVLSELPPKSEIEIFCELSAGEREIYNAALSNASTESTSALGVLEKLLRLRQICCHPSLIDGLGDFPAEKSGKVELFESQIVRSLNGEHRILVFSQWTSFLDLLEDSLKELGIDWLRLDGSTRDRASVISDFQSGTGPAVFLISLKAGGLGLTLTNADHIYLMDPWWNPAVEEQAIARAHRMGQTEPVTVYRFLARNTIEERVRKLQLTKNELLRDLFDETHDSASRLAQWQELLQAEITDLEKH